MCQKFSPGCNLAMLRRLPPAAIWSWGALPYSTLHGQLSNCVFCEGQSGSLPDSKEIVDRKWRCRSGCAEVHMQTSLKSGSCPAALKSGSCPAQSRRRLGCGRPVSPVTAQGRLWYGSDLAGRPGNGLNLRRTFQQWPLPIMNATTLMQRNLKDSAKGQPSSGAQAKAFALQISGSRSLVGCSCWV